MDLFEEKTIEEDTLQKPLAERMRPRHLRDIVGQRHIVGDQGIISRFIEQKQIPSLILWGPPGSGKTTLAKLITEATDANMVSFSAVLSGVKEIRQVLKEADYQTKSYKKKTILFVDEIHRFNKVQQDAFLHHVEDGTLTLIGATTENPSFEINTPLISRCKVIVLNKLSEADMKVIVRRALDDREHGMGRSEIDITDDANAFIAAYSQGDARMALNLLEIASMLLHDKLSTITVEVVRKAAQKKILHYDKSGEEHYNIISAFIKSLRGSNPDAALYWLARMVESGEDPLFIARRMVIFASEDIGNADPTAITLALSVKDSVNFVGMPEGWIPLAHGTTYLATAPKSNASYTAYKKAANDARENGALPVPLHIRNAPTSLMKSIGYGKGYKYPHDFEGGLTYQDYLPNELESRIYYEPTDHGREGDIKKRMDRKKS